MTTINAITLEVNDLAAAQKFYDTAFDLGDRLTLRTADSSTSGFRGFTISLLTSQPANVSALVDAAVAAGATVLKPVSASLWGVGGVVQAPDGAIWKVATSAKKDTAPASKAFDDVVVLLAATDVRASKKFYTAQGFTVGKSFGSYVDFDLKGSPVKLGLYKRRALAKDAGVAEEGSGSHRIALVTDTGAFTDPDGFVGE